MALLLFYKEDPWERFFITDFNSGNIQKQCSPLTSGSPWWGWHTSLPMLLVHLIVNRITVLTFILNIAVSCLLLPPLYINWCHNVTRQAGELESSSGHQQCYDGTSQDTSCYATRPPPPSTDKQAVRGLTVKIVQYVRGVFSVIRSHNGVNLSFDELLVSLSVLVD